MRTATRIFDLTSELDFEEADYNALPSEMRNAFDELLHIDLRSHVGQECQAILTLAAPLLSTVDPVSRPLIWTGVIHAMWVLLNG